MWSFFSTTWRIVPYFLNYVVRLEDHIVQSGQNDSPLFPGGAVELEFRSKDGGSSEPDGQEEGGDANYDEHHLDPNGTGEPVTPCSQGVS